MKTCIRIVFVCMTMILCVPAAMAQDTLFMKNGQKIASQITEVTPSIVRYKKPENPDGPSYVIYTNDLNVIKYRNGSLDTIVHTTVTTNTAVVTTKSPIFQTPATTGNLDPYPPITPSNSKYLYGSKRIKKPEMQSILKSVNNEDINRHVKKAKLAKNFKWVGYVAIPPAALGLGFLALGSMVPDGVSMGLICMGVAAVPFGTSITSRYLERKHNNAAIKIYNEKY